MIDEKKLIDELKQSGMIADNEYGNAMVDMIESQPKIGEWIPCSERLPKKSNSYFVTKHIAESEDCTEQYETCSEIFWTRDNKWDCERDPDCEWKVIAWQPLPETYHEELRGK